MRAQIYVDRIEGDSYVRKDVWEEWNKPDHGDMDYISKTKGWFDEKHFVRVPYHDAGKMVSQKIAHFVKNNDGNSIDLYGSGQLIMEGQYIENLFMKGVSGSCQSLMSARMGKKHLPSPLPAWLKHALIRNIACHTRARNAEFAALSARFPAPSNGT